MVLSKLTILNTLILTRLGTFTFLVLCRFWPIRKEPSIQQCCSRNKCHVTNSSIIVTPQRQVLNRFPVVLYSSVPIQGYKVVLHKEIWHPWKAWPIIYIYFSPAVACLFQECRKDRWKIWPAGMINIELNVSACSAWGNHYVGINQYHLLTDLIMALK